MYPIENIMFTKSFENWLSASKYPAAAFVHSPQGMKWMQKDEKGVGYRRVFRKEK